MTGLLLAWLVGLAAGTPSPAGEICVVTSASTIDGLSESSLHAAWAVRQAVDELNATLVIVADAHDCTDRTVLTVWVGDASQVVLAAVAEGESGRRWSDNLGRVEPDARGRALCQVMAAALFGLSETDATPPPPLPPPDSQTTENPPAPSPPDDWRVGLDGGASIWTGTPSQSARLGASAALLVNHRPSGFVVGLGAAWLPRAALDTATPATMGSGSGALLAGWQTRETAGLGGRLLGGLGLEWRNLDVAPSTRLDTISAQTMTPFAVAAADLAWSFNASVALELGAEARIYTTTTTHTLADTPVSEAPRVSAALHLRLRGWFN